MAEGFKVASGDQPGWDTIHSERLTDAMAKAFRIERSMDEIRRHARMLIAEIKASPLNPHGDNDAAIVDDLIDTIDVLKSETWEQVRRALIRGKIQNI